jgi:hypothetical protein
MCLDEEIPRVLEGQPCKGGVVGEPVEPDVLRGEGNL